MSLSKGVYSKDDFGKLKIKDSNHTRRSKQNTYHVVNKNIAPSKVTNGSRRKRGCLPGHPQALTFWCPWIILGVPWASPWLGSCHYLFHDPSKSFTQNLKPSQHKTQQKISWAPLAKENKRPLQGTVMNSFFIYIGVKPTVFQLLYGSYPPILAIDTSK